MSFYSDANFILSVCARSDNPEAAAEAERALRWLARRELPDTLHVGWAQAEQCTMFGSFDTASGTRALAYARGLRVWPEMKEADFHQYARLKR